MELTKTDEGYTLKKSEHCYAVWKKKRRCENCISQEVLRTHKPQTKIETRESDIYYVLASFIEVDGRLCFRPRDPVTRAEAAVICNAILGAETPERIPTFADNSAIPTWAKPSLYALSDLGILRGTGDGNLSPDSPISRAQAAQMLYKIRQYLAE